jgi:hypothetical protein
MATVNGQAGETRCGCVGCGASFFVVLPPPPRLLLLSTTWLPVACMLQAFVIGLVRLACVLRDRCLVVDAQASRAALDRRSSPRRANGFGINLSVEKDDLLLKALSPRTLSQLAWPCFAVVPTKAVKTPCQILVSRSWIG